MTQRVYCYLLAGYALVTVAYRTEQKQYWKAT